MQKNMLKRAMALSCAFALSLTPAVENTAVNAQTNAEENSATNELKKTEDIVTATKQSNTEENVAVTEAVNTEETTVPVQDTDEDVTENTEQSAAERSEKSLVSTQGMVQGMATNSTATVTDEASLKSAVGNSKVKNIKLKNHIKLSSRLEINHNVTIESASSDKKVIAIQNKDAARLVEIQNGAVVTFNNVTLKGGYADKNGKDHAQTSNTVLTVVKGKVNLNSCKVFLSNGILVRVRENGTVSANNTIFRDGSGMLENKGGAIRIESGGKFTMDGNQSAITDNAHGGVYIMKNGIFTMNEGSITGNKGGVSDKNGGGVFNSGTFNFKGGTISNNSATGLGNNVFNMGTMTVSGGVTVKSIYLQSGKLTFDGAPTAAASARLASDAQVGTVIAYCGSNVSAKACLSIEGKKIANDPQNSKAIIITEDYNITFDSGNGSPTTETKAYHEQVTFPDGSNLTKTGFTFLNWQGADGTTYESNTTVDVTAKATYTANWEAKTIKVEYYDGDKHLQSDSYKFDKQDEFSFLTPENKKGFNFKHWTDKDNKTYTPKTALNRTDTDADLELTAVYEAKAVPLSFNLSMEGATMTGETPGTIKYTDKLSLASYKPTILGYDFKGWYTSKDCTGVALTDVSPEELANDDGIELYAKWEASDIPITYNCQGVTMTNAQTSVKYDQSFNLPSAPEKKGFVFKGWHLNNDTNTLHQMGTKICPKDTQSTTITLTAVYEVAPTPTPTTKNNSSSSMSKTSTSGKVTESKLEETLPGSAPNTASGSGIDLQLSTYSKKLGVGDSFRITISTNDAYSVSSNSNIVDVDNLGNVKAKAAGTALISVKTATTTKICKITVKKAPKASTMKVFAKKVKRGKTVSVKPWFTKNTYCKSVKYKTSNKKIASVSGNGKVKGLKKGTVKITIKCSTGAKKIVKIKVV